jgi:hypothetical protein
MSALQNAIVAKVGGAASASEFALQMIRLPYRQVYGPEEAISFGSLFAATLSFADIRQWPGYQPVVAAQADVAAQAEPAQPGDQGEPR